MTKTLLLMRHGKSSWKDESLPDIKRPLKKRGEEDSEAIGKILKHKKLLPDVILTSPAKRARQTAEISAKEAGISKRVVVVDALYMAEVQDIFNVLLGLEGNPDLVMVVGHNPGLEATLQTLDGRVSALPTGSMACLRLEVEDWKTLSIDTAGEMVGFWNPDDDKKEYKKGVKKEEKKDDKKDDKKDKK
ncbi:MAG: histidine phosphatase family protein [Anaerolineaceae bacterium]